MKILKNNSILIRGFMMVICFAFFTACEEGANFRIQEYPEQTATGISQTMGYPGVNVTITGTDFGTLKGAVKVYFGGILATNVVSCEDTKIVVQVPANAVSGKVTLQVWKHINDSFADFTVLPAPAITSVASNNATNPIVAYPDVDIVTIKGINFGTDASKVGVSFNGTAATIKTIADNMITVLAPTVYASGFVTVTMGGLTIQGSTAIINPTAPGDITAYFLANYLGSTVKPNLYDGSRWGTLAAPWVSNAAAINKGIYGGYQYQTWSVTDSSTGIVYGKGGYVDWETWGNTPVVDGMIYQTITLPAGNYSFSFTYYAEVQTDSSVYGVVSAGTTLPTLANLNTALGSVLCYNGTVIGTTKPNKLETLKIDFILANTQKVSLGFLGNLKGRATNANYFELLNLKLVKN